MTDNQETRRRERNKRVSKALRLRDWDEPPTRQVCADCVEIAVHDECRAINRQNRARQSGRVSYEIESAGSRAQERKQ